MQDYPPPPATLKVWSYEITCMVGKLKKEIENLPALLEFVHLGCMIVGAREYHEVTTVCIIVMFEGL